MRRDVANDRVAGRAEPLGEQACCLMTDNRDAAAEIVSTSPGSDGRVDARRTALLRSPMRTRARHWVRQFSPRQGPSSQLQKGRGGQVMDLRDEARAVCKTTSL